MQADTAQDVAKSLKAKLTGDDQRLLAKTTTSSPDAYKLYLRGRFYQNQLTPESLHRAVEQLQLAIRADPGYADAYASLAGAYVTLRGLDCQVPEPGLMQPTRRLVRTGQGGKPLGYAVPGRPPIWLPGRLDLFPAGRDVFRRHGVALGEHVRVTADELVDDATCHVVDPERRVRVLLGYPRVEGHLQQDVAELLLDVRAVPGLDGLHQLVRLFDEVGHE